MKFFFLVFLISLNGLKAHSSPQTDETGGLPAQLEMLSRAPGVGRSLCARQRIGCTQLSRIPFPSMDDLPALNRQSGFSFCEGRASMLDSYDLCRQPQPAVAVSTPTESSIASNNRAPTEAESATQNRFDRNYRPPTIASKKKQGFTYVIEALRAKPERSQQDIREAVRDYSYEFTATKGRMVSDCCGSDKRCKKAFLGIQARFCKPTKDETCTTGAFYQNARNGNKEYIDSLKMRIAYHRAKKNLSEATMAQLESAARHIAPIDIISNYVRSLTGNEYDTSEAPIVPGQVIVAPFYREGSFESDLRTLEHELAHGCSHIKRQISALNTDDSAEFVSTFNGLYPKTRMGACSSSLQLDSYKALFSKGIFAKLRMTPKEIDLTMACFAKVSHSAQIGNSARAKCDNACPAEYLEEAYAEFQRLDLNQPVSSVAQICNVGRDSLHGFTGDFAECIAQNSEHMRAFLRHGLMCGVNIWGR